MLDRLHGDLFLDTQRLRRTISFVLLILIVAFFSADRNLIPPKLLEIKEEFGVGEAALGLVGSVFVIVSALITIVWGMLADIYSRKKLLLIGTLLGEIPCFLTAFAQDYWQLLVLRVFTGIGIGSLAPITATLVADMFKGSRRGIGYGYIYIALGAGTLIGMIIAGVYPNWRAPFIIVSVPNWILAPLFYIVYPEPRRGESEDALKKLYETGLEYTYRLSWDTAKKSLKTTTNILIFLQGSIGTLPWGVMVYYSIGFLVISRGMNPSVATFVLAILGLALLIGNPIGGFLGDWAEARRPGGRAIVTGLAIFLGMIASIGFILYPWPGEPGLGDWLFISLYALLFIQLISYAGPNVNAIVSQVNLPEDRGTMFGVFSILDNIGASAGPLIGGLLIEYFRSIGYPDATSYMYTLIIGALFWIPCSIVWIFISKHYPRDNERIQKTLEERVVKILEK